MIRAHAIRKVVDLSDATGSSNSTRVHLDLTIRVESTFFDPSTSLLRVTGIVRNENSTVGLGQHHTLSLELNRAFTLWKKYGWDSVAVEELKEALRDDRGDTIAAVIMSDNSANVCIISAHQTIVKQRIEGSLPKKLAASSDVQSGTNRFFDDVLTALLDAVDFSMPRLLLLASPGFTARNFRAFMTDKGARTGDSKLGRIGREAVVVHTSTGNTHSLNEALRSPEVAARMSNAKSRSESKIMDEVMERLRKDDGRVAYGVLPVTHAVDEGAVGRGGGVLLINNGLFRSQDIATRKRFVAIVDKVKEYGGETILLSSDHESGQRLDGLGGIAAILTYPIYELDEGSGLAGDSDGEGDTII